MDNIIPIRAGETDSDKQFCQKIDVLVRRFNEIANQEIFDEPKPVTELSGLEDVQAAITEVGENFQRNLTKTTMPQKIESLKNVFGAIGDLAMDALRDLEIQGDEFLEPAIQRVFHVLDVMNDDASDYAPELVRSDEIYKDEKWKPVLEERDRISNDLRNQLDALYARQSP